MTSAPTPTDSNRPVIVVTGANGLVGSHVCAALAERGASVRAIVRTAGTAPQGTDIEERVGEFTDPAFAAETVAGADAVVTTVHPMGSSRDVQEQIGVVGTTTIAQAAADAGVDRLVHISTAAVYERSPQTGDVDESGALVSDDDNDYSVTKRDTDAALAEVDGITRILLRPPAILGAGESSVWNTLRPSAVREHESQRHAVADQSFAWVHVTDLAALAADVAVGQVASSDDPATGPVSGACTPLNVAAAPARVQDYHSTVAGAVGVEPVWDDDAVWTGSIVADRAHAWGWTPTTTLDDALAELRAGLTS
ncbi:NAD-dependent epimerase/dehydratase family protein [Aeromicrobium sp. CF3.5]|uniref:NAD-dependent epimerase/dehydratase family protein n=1 Tax=Aeromicrobium sp. CF3.5 TaxID=3373078 RepID=UPI003EE5FCEE